MRILWITNMVLPPLSKALNIKGGSSGTWMFDIADKLSSDNDIDFAVACVHGQTFLKKEVDGATYYCIPGNGKDMIFYRPYFKKYWKQIVDDFKPDIVNIHGTEYCHALSFVREYKDKLKIVISLQGMLNKIKEFDFAGIQKRELFFNKTLKEWIKFNDILFLHKIHCKNAKSEREMLESVKYSMAVDDWHYSVAKELNPNIEIFKINYNLREEFYTSAKWDINKIERHTISANPGGTPLKGLHMLFRAVALVKRFYPDVKVKVPGMRQNASGLVVNSGYAKYLKKLINKLNLQDNIVFLGPLDSEQMKENMLSSHVQVVPSSIEGPSLILHEGMHLGVPSIATFKGGMADFIDDKVNGFLYEFYEYQYLALRIIQIFSSDELAVKLSKNAIVKAEQNHDREVNYNNYLKMYREIYKN